MTTQTINKQASRSRNRFNINKIRLGIDLVLLVSMLIAISPAVTGIPVHEWVGFLVLVPILFHLVADWRWIVNTTKRLFKRQPGEVRFNYLINWIQFVLLLLATVSGIVISEVVLPAFGLVIPVDHYWIAMHEISAGVLTVFLGIHVAMHWRWLANAFRRYILKQPAGAK